MIYIVIFSQNALAEPLSKNIKGIRMLLQYRSRMHRTNFRTFRNNPFAAWAFLSSGAVQIIFSAFIICFMDIEIACAGTSSTDLNQPSPICCLRQASSKSTIIKGGSLNFKESAGGSLNASAHFRLYLQMLHPQSRSLERAFKRWHSAWGSQHLPELN